MFVPMRIAILVYVGLTILTGVVYPLAVTAIAQLVLPDQANGSLLFRDGKCIGSKLIGQEFVSPEYFRSRPSATSPNAYNAASSGGSNLGPTNPALQKVIEERVASLRAAIGGDEPVPVDLVTASASGLDPEISIAAAEYQIPRVANARGLKDDEVRRLVNEHTQNRQFGVFGESRVNVLPLNVALDAMQPTLRTQHE